MGKQRDLIGSASFPASHVLDGLDAASDVRCGYSVTTVAGLLELIADAEATATRLRNAGSTPSGFTAIRPRHLDPVFAVLEQATDWLFSHQPGGPDVVGERLLELCRVLLADPCASYHGVRDRLRLLQARLHIRRGEWAEADRAIGPLVFRPYIVGDNMETVRQAMLLDRHLRPNLVPSMPAWAGLLLERLLFLFSRFPQLHHQLDLLEEFAVQLNLLFRLPSVREHVARCSGIPEEVLGNFEAAVTYLHSRRHWPNRETSPRRLIYKAVRGSVFRQVFGVLRATASSRTTFALSSGSVHRVVPNRPAHRTLVTRAMGGVGDLVTMVPGLVALAVKTGAPVHFAVPRELLAVVSGFPEIVPLSIDDDIALEDYETWFNLGECPAARVEVATMPNVDRGRIEAFANAVGITAADLDRSGWTARFQLTDRQQHIRQEFRRIAHESGRKLIGIAPFSREEYKRAPALIEAAERLAQEHQVVILHSRQLPVLDRAGLRIAETPDLASLVAVIAACDHVLTIDTAHVHIAGALSVSTLAIFGPTDGRFMTRHYPKTRLLQPWTSCPVMPCWRNEDAGCRLSLGPESVCLEHLRVSDIMDAFAAVEREVPTPAEIDLAKTLTAA